MYFEDTMRYDLTKGFGTTTLAYPVELINQNFSEGSSDVDLPGFEPES